MRSYELFALDPTRLSPELVGDLACQLACFCEIPRTIEVLQAIDPDQLSLNDIDEIAFHFYQAKEIEALRWLIDWAPSSVNLSFEMEVLLATPAERLQLLQTRARDAFDAERSGDRTASTIFCDLGHAALAADPALGILIARGVLPVIGWIYQAAMIEEIEDARDLLRLDDKEPGYEIIDATEQVSIDKARHVGD